MIFNPLFINDAGNNQMLVSKPGKLSNNKYLFSDIVKVIMNPGEGQKLSTKSNLDNIIENKIKLSLNGDQKPVRLKFKFLSDTDNEQTKLDLADLLPEEIAHLLINKEALPSEEKAVSYISKEPLKGELKSFLYELIGPEIIEKHLNENSGLLLSMEDKKSAVNLELVKDADEKSTNNEIMVQTLVVPEKAKLLSLIGDAGNNETFFKLNNSSEITLDTNTKPSLSVYSFKFGDEQFESLTKSLKSGFGSKTDLVKNLNGNLADINGKIEKVPLEKISFVPSELKKQSIDTIKGIYNQSKNVDANVADLRLYKHNGEYTEKDFSVSKITIFKKQGSDSEQEIKTNKIETGKSTNENLGKIKLNGGPTLHVLSKEKSETVNTVDNSKNNNLELKIVSSDLKSLAKSFKNEITNELKNIPVNIKNNLSDVKTSKNLTTIDLNNKSEKSELKNVTGNLKEVKNLKAPKVINHMTLKTENVKYEKTINASQESNKIAAKLNDSKININEIKTDVIKNESKIYMPGNTEVKDAKNSTEFKINAVNKDPESKNTEIKVKLGSQNVTIKDLNNTANLKSEIVEKDDVGISKKENKITNEIKNLSETKIKTNEPSLIDKKYEKNELEINKPNKKATSENKNISETKTKTTEQPISNDKTESKFKIDLSNVSTKERNISEKINPENVKTENLKPEAKLETGLDKKVISFENKLTNESNNIKHEDKIERKSEVHENNILKNAKSDNSSKTSVNQEVKVDQNNSAEDKKINDTSVSTKKEINSAEPKADEKTELKANKENSELLQKTVVSNAFVNSNENEVKENNSNKKISIKVKGEIKSVTDKNELKNMAVDEKASSSKQNNNSETSEQNANTALKNSTISHNNTELKNSGENNFSNTLNKEISHSLQPNVQKSNGFENTDSQRIVKSIEVIKEITEFISKKENGSLSFEIRPEHLGKMKITLDTVDNLLKARIEVDNEQSKQLVEKNLDKLHQQLGENGIQLNSLNISLGNPKHRYEQETVNQQSSQRKEENFENNEEQKKQKQKKQLGYNTYEYIA